MPRPVYLLTGFAEVPSGILFVALSLAVSTGPAFAFEATERAQDPERLVEIRLVNGRVSTGEIHGDFDERRLWLRYQRPGIVLIAPVDWTEIAAVRHKQRSISVQQLQQLCRELAESPDPFQLPPSRGAAVPASAQGDRRGARVASLLVRAAPANWDADVEADGIELQVVPQDTRGRLIPVNGSLSVQLTGQRITNGRRLQRPLPASYPRIGIWEQPVRESDFSASGAVYRLEYRRAHPSFDLDLASFAQVNAQLRLPGEGAFSASAPVRLRRYEPIREQLQLREGVRFFPGEQTGRRPR